MAIVKAKYVRSKPRIKAHLRYITHRRGGEGEHITRPLFGREGPLSKQQIYDTIDKARPGTVFHKFVINCHPVKEDTHKDLNLWELTRKTLEHIKTKFGDSVPFVATIHDDHTLLRHIHGFFIVEGKLNKEESRLDRMHKTQGYQKLLPHIEKYKRKRGQGRGLRMRNIRTQPACQHCGFGGRYGMPAYLLVCPVCKQWLTHSNRQQLHVGRRLHR
jgi:hypothetical protein